MKSIWDEPRFLSLTKLLTQQKFYRNCDKSVGTIWMSSKGNKKN